MNRRILQILWCICLVFSSHAYAQDNLSALIPMPNKVATSSKAPLVLQGDKVACYIQVDSLQFELKTVASLFQIRLLIDKSLKKNDHYKLSVNNKRLEIKGASAAAVFYGLMTLDQVLAGDVCATKQQAISAIEINDCPRFGYRALMLDPARNFLPVNELKFYIDQMVKYKFNVLQLHLSDDQGWSIWIETYPKLAGNRFYTKQDIQELVEYAEQRHVQVVPEIDVPGHTVSLLAKYPDMACIHQREAEKIIGKTGHMMLCAGNEEVYVMMDDIIREVAGMFKSPLMHLGGDEADIPKNWAKCDLCRLLMKKKNYTEPVQLMIPFFENILALPEYNNWGMPMTTLERAYRLDPGYGRPLSKQQHIWGVMGALWGEAIIDINRATYMSFPRAFALAEAGWTQMENRSWESFKKRVLPNVNELMKAGVSIRVPFEIAR